MNKEILCFQDLKSRLGSAGIFILKSSLVFIFVFTFLNGYQSVHAADCSSGNFSGIYEDLDVTLSGDLFVTGNVTIRNNVKLTLEAGSTVTMCGAYQISVSGGGNLVAIGTPDLPITISANDPATKWNSIIFLGAANHSILQHVILNDGGGSDASDDKGVVEFVNLAANPLPSPTLNHVIINNSGAYGMNLRVNSDDETPPSINNIMINNSASGALLVNAQTLGGLGSNNQYVNNNPNTIQVISGGGSRLYHSQIWQNQGIPFEMLGDAIVAAETGSDDFPRLTIKEGITFLMHPNASLIIGTSLGRGGTISIEGTADEPTLFTRLNDSSAPWDRLWLQSYPNTVSKIQHANFLFGGGGSGTAAIYQSGEGTLTLENVQTNGSAAAGFHGRGIVRITDSKFELNQTGLEFFFTSDAIIRNSTIRNNVVAGLVSLDTGANFTRNCVDAIGNNWGSLDGPNETYSLADACGISKTNNGAGDAVSGGVIYEPWLPTEDTLQDRGTILPIDYYVIANGVANTTVNITLRDINGTPLSGKSVHLNTTVGTVIQPAQPTDINGKTTALISSTTTGYAYLSAINLTDSTPISGLAGVTFWQGPGDAGGLISSNGSPYASPQLLITGQPFQAGFPVGMSVPMLNSNPHPIEVEVIYGVSGLNIGAKFAPVYTTSITLQPNESWDAQAVWLPTSTGHQCIQAQINTNSSQPDLFQTMTENTTTRQRNTDPNPCSPSNLNVNDLIPTSFGVGGVGKHTAKATNTANKANKCIFKGLSYDSMNMMNVESERDHQQIFIPPTFTPPLIEDFDLTSEELSILNNMAQVSADLLSLNIAIGETAQRMNWAAQTIQSRVATAGSVSSSMQFENGHYYLDIQYQAFRDYMNQYADNLDTYANLIESLLLVMEEDDDYHILAEDYVNTKNSLKIDGFDAETLTYYQQTGLSSDLIIELEQSLVNMLDNQPAESQSFFEVLGKIKTSMLELANRLRTQYPIPASSSMLSTKTNSMSEPTVYIPPQEFQFQVGHPFTGQKTVELVVRPVSLPLSWTYELSQQSIVVNEDETVDVILTLYPGSDLIQGDLVQLSVEGFVNGELVGGILMEYLTPYIEPRSTSYQVFLPNIVR
ncbi:MAG TPA: Ig-like domain-containing protein [Anaerolineaceae bacterium]|nr:Ig-like domain-containing protein [Anaerolineaceae bacterium]